MPACAITIHKSQGGTFDSVVVQYDKKHDQQLVYVALSRATTITGLHIVNMDGDNEFYQGRGCDSPSVRDIRDEYARLRQHQLRTVTDRAEAFCKIDENGASQTMMVVAHNVQSIHAHSKDIETDEIMEKAEYLVLNETWMAEDDIVPIRGFELASSKKREPGRTAGGVAIYRNVHSLTYCEPILPIPEIEELFAVRSGVGDICLAGVNLNGRRLCVLGSVYIHPTAKMAETKLVCHAALARYGTAILSIIPELEVELDVPIALMGDINVDINKRPDLARWLHEQFWLQHHPNALPMTNAGTCIDHVFLRNMKVECMPYVSYFSHHRPLLNKLKSLPCSSIQNCNEME